MSKDTKILDYAKYVENEKDKLYEHCKENNIKINKNSSLDKIVSANNLINNPTNENKIRVRVFDYDGELLDVKYYNLGETIPEPEPPTPKDSRLVFKKWVKSVDSLIAEKDFDFGALYECNITKEVDGNICKVNIIDCSFDEEYTGLNVSIPLYLYGYKACIDWGDGSDISEITTSGNITHSYTKSGNYSIIIYGYGTSNGSIFHFQTSSTRLLLGTEQATKAVRKVIFNGNYTFRDSSYLFYRCINMESCVVSMKDLRNVNESGVFTNDIDITQCYSLKAVIIPDIEYGQYSISGYSTYSLKIIVLPPNCKKMSINTEYIKLDVIFPENIKRVGTISYSSLKRLQLKNLSSSSIPGIGRLPYIEIIDLYESACNNFGSHGEWFNNCRSLKEVILPKTLVRFNATSSFVQCPNLKNLVIPDSVIEISSSAFTTSCSIENLTIPNQWASDINFINFYSLNINSWISIANRIKDLSGESPKVITVLNTYYPRLKDVYLNSFGIQVDKDTEGAINILDFIRNKNWTISIRN